MDRARTCSHVDPPNRPPLRHARQPDVEQPIEPLGPGEGRRQRADVVTGADHEGVGGVVVEPALHLPEEAAHHAGVAVGIVAGQGVVHLVDHHHAGAEGVFGLDPRQAGGGVQQPVQFSPRGQFARLGGHAAGNLLQLGTAGQFMFDHRKGLLQFGWDLDDGGQDDNERPPLASDSAAVWPVSRRPELASQTASRQSFSRHAWAISVRASWCSWESTQMPVKQAETSSVS